MGPLFLRTSSYAHVWPSREHVLQLGLMPSHLSFLFLQIMHARRFGLGTAEFPRAAPVCSALGSDTMTVSRGEFDDDDMLGTWRHGAGATGGCGGGGGERSELRGRERRQNGPAR